MRPMLLWVAVVVLLVAVLAVAAHLGRTALVRRLHGARIEREVRALFGPQAEVTRIEIDTRWRLVLAGKNLHIPGGLTLDAREARLRGISRPDSLVLETLEGTLRWKALEAPIRYRVGEQPTAPVHGSLVARGATWRPGAPAFDFDGTVRIARNDYTVTGTKIVCEGASGSGELRGTDGPPRTKLHFEEVGANLLAHLVALLGDHPLAIPAKARTAGDLEIDPDFTRRLDATLTTESSRLAAALRVSPADRLDGSKVTGTLSFADANEARIFTGRLKPEAAGDATVDLEVSGPTNDWLLAGKTRAARVAVDARSVRPEMTLVLAATDVVCAVEVRQHGVRWSGFEASFLGGRIAGSGALDAKSHASELRVEGVRIEDLPVGLEEPLLEGVGSGTFTIRGEGDETAKLEGEGDLELAEPDYRFLEQAGASLQAFGLPPLPLRGTSPLRARLQLTGGRILFREIAGRVDGMRFDGNVELTWKGGLAGRIEAHLDDRYLSKSLLLALPALFTGQVTIPLTISGKVGAPRYDADLVGTIGKLVSKNSVTGAIGGIVDGLLGNLLGGGDRRDSSERGDPKRRKPRGGLGGFLDSLSG